MVKVSVILTTYNGETRGFLSEAIESVLHQTYKDFELIMVDDGSTDNTQKLCEEYLSDTRVKYINQVNRGVSSARNTGIRASSGDYICFLDDDDAWLPEKVEKQLYYFSSCKDEKIGLVHTWVDHIDENGDVIGHGKIETAGNIYNKLFEQNVINALSSVMVKSGVFEKVGIFKEHMIHVEDIELWFRVARDFHVYSINEPLTRYRVHHMETLSTCYEKNTIFMQLVYYYALEENDNGQNKGKLYKKVYEKYAIKSLGDGNYNEFRHYCKMAKVYGFLPFSLLVRYWLAYFPKCMSLIQRYK
jgi:glycosyltransferase involved in cell wall biosynthesis